MKFLNFFLIGFFIIFFESSYCLSEKMLIVNESNKEKQPQISVNKKNSNNNKEYIKRKIALLTSFLTILTFFGTKN